MIMLRLPSILRRRAKKLFPDFRAQGFRAQNLDVGPVFQDVEDELTGVGIRDFENVVAVFEPASLLRVPGFIRHTAGAFGREAQ